jgi:hypothetical protein
MVPLLLPVVCVLFRREESWACVRGVVVAIALLALFDLSPARAENVTAKTANENDFNPFVPCPKCGTDASRAAC